MDERALNEFESVFEAAIRPSVEIQPVSWSRIVVGLDGSERSSTAVAVSLHLAKRLGTPLRFVATRALLQGEERDVLASAIERWQTEAVEEATRAGVDATGIATIGLPGEVILNEIVAEPTSLLIIPTPHGGQTPDETTLGSTVDHLLTASDCPALLIKAPLEAPEAVFQRILAWIPGGFEIGPHFSIPFALVEPQGSLELMHIVDEEEVHRYAAAFEITPDGDAEEEKAKSMIEALEERMTKLLEAAVAEVKQEPFSCRSLVTEGNPIQRVALRLLNEGDTLLVVESESRPETPVQPEAYAMLKEVTGVPVLAL